MNSWLLVANSRRGKIFSIADARGELTELADFVHPAPSRLGDNPTGHISAAARGTRHGMEPATLPKEKEVHEFAAELAQYLEREFSQQHFSKLTLAAAPEFLGELRATLPENIRAAVTVSINKDLLSYSAAELSTYLREQTGLH